MTSAGVPRGVRERVEAVAPQLYEQDQLSEEMDQHFSPLREASSVAFGVSDKAPRRGRFPRPGRRTVSGGVLASGSSGLAVKMASKDQSMWIGCPGAWLVLNC